MKYILRPSQERGHADHGWLQTFLTFSFAGYQSSGHDQFGALRVINEDRIAPSTGFGTHGHKEFEIFTYIVAGEVEHKDSMGNTEILKRGDIQLTSAGTGITHSEKAHGSKPVHLLQIWSFPSISRLTPKYFTRHFTDEQKKDQWLAIVAPVGAEGVTNEREGTGPAPVQSPLTLYSSLISPSAVVTHIFHDSQTKNRKGYLQVVQTSGYNTKTATGAHIKITDEDGQSLELREGDGVYIFAESLKKLTVENVGDRVSEVLLFDLEGSE